MSHSAVDEQSLKATNSFPSAEYTEYVNAGLVYESDGGLATKHYYAGPLRVASQIGSGDPVYESHPVSGWSIALVGPMGSKAQTNGQVVLDDFVDFPFFRQV